MADLSSSELTPSSVKGEQQVLAGGTKFDIDETKGTEYS